MRDNPTEVVDGGRLIDDYQFGTPRGSGPQGVYIVPGPEGLLKIICSDGTDRGEIWVRVKSYH